MKPSNTPRSKFTIVRDTSDTNVTREIHVNLLDYSITPDQANKFIAQMELLQAYVHKIYVVWWNISEDLYKRFIRFTGEDYQQLLDAYIDENKDLFLFVLQQRAQKAMHYYIREVFFDDYVLSDIDEAIKQMKHKYAMVNDDTIDICKRKSFNQICMLSLLDELDQELPGTTKRVIQDIEKEGPIKDWDEGKVILHGVVQTTLIAACNEQFLIERFAKHWQDAARSICKEEQKNALYQHAKKHFFAAHKHMYYGWDAALTAEMDQYMQNILPNYPLLNSSTKHKYKAKSFYMEAQEQYGKYCLHYIDQAINKDISLFEDSDIYIQLSEQLFNIDTYKYFLKEKLKHIFDDFCADKAKRMEQEKKKAQQIPKQTMQNSVHVAPRAQESNKLTPEQEKLLEQLETKMLNRVKIDITYITRMLKKWWPIYVESLVEDMWSWYSQELLEEMIGILQQFDVEIITRKDKEIRDIVDGWDNLGNNKNTWATTQVQIWSIITGLALDVLLQNPEKLTWSVLLVVLEKSWYKFISKKDFLRQAEDILGIRERKSALPIQKKMVDALRMGENVRDRRKSGKWRNCASYEVLVFETEWIRLVKQGKTICWLLDHDAYEKKINIEFTQNNNDYSAIADNTSTHLLVKWGDSTRYTPEHWDQLSSAC